MPYAHTRRIPFEPFHPRIGDTSPAGAELRESTEPFQIHEPGVADVSAV